MGVLLVPLERRVAALRPTPRVVGVAVRATDVVDPLHRFVRRLEDAVEELHLVHHPVRPALLRGAVVGQDHHDRVVEPAEVAQSVDEPADLVVGVVEERGERLLEAARQPLLGVGEVVPRLDAGIARREFGAFRHDAEFELPREPPLAHDVPALVVAPAVLLEVARRRLVRGVRRTERQVQEEGPVGSDADAVGHHPQRLVDQVFAQVVPVRRARRWIDRVVVAHELGVELVGLAFQESVEPVEPAGQRPLVERTGSRALLHRGEVPLADAEGGVALLAQHLGHGGGVVRDVAELVREPGAEVGDRPHPDRVLGPAGEQRRPRRRAQRGHVEIRELDTLGGKGIDVRRVDVGPVATELGEARVVEQDDHHIGCVGTGVWWLVKPGLRIGQRAADRPFEARWACHGCASVGCVRYPSSRMSSARIHAHARSVAASWRARRSSLRTPRATSPRRRGRSDRRRDRTTMRCARCGTDGESDRRDATADGPRRRPSAGSRALAAERDA